MVLKSTRRLTPIAARCFLNFNSRNLFKDTLHKLLRYFKSIDLVFFIFLLLILNVSIVVKLLAILFIYVLRPNFRFGWTKGRLPRFYFYILILFVAQIPLNYSIWSEKYFFLTGLGLFYWLASLAIIHQIKLAIETNGTDKVHRALTLFFGLNSAISFLNILYIIYSTKVLNPYTFEGMSLKYHISTGDWITGIIFDFSLTNSFVSLLGVVYFLYNRNYIMSAVSLIVMLLATSNANTLLLILALLFVLLFNRDKVHKSLSLVFLAIIVVFYARVSPENIDYTVKTVNTGEQLKTAVKYLDTATVKKEVIKRNQKDLLLRYMSLKTKKKDTLVATEFSIEKESKINSVLQNIRQSENTKSSKVDEQTKTVQSARHVLLIDFIKKIYGDTTINCMFYQGRRFPGKVVSFLETKDYCLSGIRHLTIGSGAGLFSSKLAFKASGVGEFGKYPKNFTYLSNEFRNNHLKIYGYYFLQTPDKHSVTNNPFSAYNQLVGEYGLVGVFLFIVFYIWFFVRRFKKLTYGRLLVPICLVFLATDYWFEHLSVLVIFETMMFLDLASHPDKELLQNNKT